MIELGQKPHCRSTPHSPRPTDQAALGRGPTTGASRSGTGTSSRRTSPPPPLQSFWRGTGSSWLGTSGSNAWGDREGSSSPAPGARGRRPGDIGGLGKQLERHSGAAVRVSGGQERGGQAGVDSPRPAGGHVDHGRADGGGNVIWAQHGKALARPASRRRIRADGSPRLPCRKGSRGWGIAAHPDRVKKE